MGVSRACCVLGVSKASFYRNRRGNLSIKKNKPPANALTQDEKQQVLNILHSERFIDKSPEEIHSILLDEGEYYCSVRTMYRILSAEGEVRERRRNHRKTSYKKPELLATNPNQVWSWDITKLKGPEKWNYYHLYVILDIYSRYAVGWILANNESSALAKELIETCCSRQSIDKDKLIIHSDRGPSMKSKVVAHLLSDLGVTKSHSRPYTSNDNPFSEAQFKTLKYCPTFPERFGCIQDARVFCRTFFDWYNREHRHGGINMLTPEIVHQGRAAHVLQQRQEVLTNAFGKHPIRFRGKCPNAGEIPKAVWINKPKVEQKENLVVKF